MQASLQYVRLDTVACEAHALACCLGYCTETENLNLDMLQRSKISNAAFSIFKTFKEQLKVTDKPDIDVKD